MKLVYTGISGLFCPSCGYAMYGSAKDSHKTGTATVYCSHGLCGEYQKKYLIQLPRYEMTPLAESESK